MDIDYEKKAVVAYGELIALGFIEEVEGGRKLTLKGKEQGLKILSRLSEVEQLLMTFYVATQLKIM